MCARMRVYVCVHCVCMCVCENAEGVASICEVCYGPPLGVTHKKTAWVAARCHARSDN